MECLILHWLSKSAHVGSICFNKEHMRSYTLGKREIHFRK
jgi:hypothetical protein